MPIETECPLCGHKGKVPDKFDGKQVKCPNCSNLFVVGQVGGANGSDQSPAGSAFGTQQVAKPGAGPTNGSAAGQMKLTPMSGSAGGNMKLPPSGSAQGTQKVAKAGASAQKGPAGSAQGSQKVKAAGKSGPGKKPAKGPADPFASFNYDAPTKGGGTPTYKKKRRRRRLVNFLLLLFLVGTCTALGVGGVKYHGQVRAAYDHLATGGKVGDLWAKLDFKGEAPPDEVGPDADPESAGAGKAASATKPDEPKPPSEIVVDVTKGPAKVGSLQITAKVSIAAPPGIEAKDKRFLITLQLDNTGKERVDFQGWGSLEPINDKLEPALVDKENDKVYKRITFAPGVRAEGQVLAKSIEPGQSLTDLLVFELPPAGTGTVTLELSAENFTEKGKFSLVFPGTLLAKAGIGPKPPDPKTEPAKPEPEEEVPPPKVLALIRPELKNKNAAARKEAVHTLAELGPGAASATPDLLEILQKDADEMIRAAAAEAIGKIGPRGRAAIPVLIEVLKKDDFWKVRAECATALSCMGPQAREMALPALEAALKDKDEMVVAAVKAAIQRFDPKAEMPKDDKKDEKKDDKKDEKK